MAEPDFLSRFDALYAPKLEIRMPTFRAVIREAIHQKAKSIVETGCIRKEDNWADGQSTIIWNDYANYERGNVNSIDINTDAADIVAKLCPAVRLSCEDSVACLAKSSSVIDLLYLDSFDLDLQNPHPAALHCFMEFCSATPRLHPGSIVFIDDSPMQPNWIVGGKGTYVAAYLQHRGIMPFTFGYQTAWLMP